MPVEFGEKMRALAICPEPHVQRLVEVNLDQAGYTVLSARTLADAEEMLVLDPHLVFADDCVKGDPDWPAFAEKMREAGIRVMFVGDQNPVLP